MVNMVVLQGRLAGTPEMRTTVSGVSLCTWRLAVGRRPDKDGERRADFVRCVAWRGLADLVCRYWDKGKMMIVVGSVRVTTYADRDGRRREQVEIHADDVSFCGDRSDGRGRQPEETDRSGLPPALQDWLQLHDDVQ